MDEMTNAINAATSPAVQMWMNWMMFIFLIAIVFAWKHLAARIVLITFILSAVVGFLIFKLSNEPHLLGIAHLLLWMPLAIYLWLKEVRVTGFEWRSVYGVWVGLLLATIGISLIFDVRDVVMVLLGLK